MLKWKANLQKVKLTWIKLLKNMVSKRLLSFVVGFSCSCCNRFVNISDEKVQSLENELKNANDLLEAARQRGT